MKLKNYINLSALFLLFFTSQVALSHGGVGSEGSNCRLTIGPYQMNFTGYQPQYSQAEEFCDDIPKIGKSTVVIDFIDKSLRDFDFEVRILNDAKDLGIEANLENIGSEEEIKKNTIYHIEPKSYISGSVVIKNDYAEKGWYIGVVTAKRASDGRTHTTVFPFSVGLMSSNTKNLAFLGAILLLLGAWYFLFKKKAKA